MSRWHWPHYSLRFRNNEKNRFVFRKCVKLLKYSSFRLIHHLYPVILPAWYRVKMTSRLNAPPASFWLKNNLAGKFLVKAMPAGITGHNFSIPGYCQISTYYSFSVVSWWNISSPVKISKSTGSLGRDVRCISHPVSPKIEPGILGTSFKVYE